MQPYWNNFSTAGACPRGYLPGYDNPWNLEYVTLQVSRIKEKLVSRIRGYPRGISFWENKYLSKLNLSIMIENIYA